MQLRRKIDNRIVLFGEPLGANLSSFASYVRERHPSVEILQVDATFRAAPEVSQRRPPRVRTLFKIARARAILSSAGPRSLALWLPRTRRPLFIDVWHGVGFKARVNSAGKAFLSLDAHFVPSPHVAEYYSAAGATSIVTGYARMDSLATASTTTASYVLVAPTWSARTHIDLRAALVTINDHAIEHAYDVVYRPHRFSDPADISDLTRVRLDDRSAGLDATEALLATSVLITDWSSIASDFLPLGRPIIYLDGQMPSCPGPLTFTDRPGAIVGNSEQLRKALTAAIVTPDVALAEYKSRRDATLERAWGDTLDGRSAERYYEAILQLEAKRERRS